MATTYSTPGVYVVEQSAFPPSVAQVPTAIPAFVGYTQTDTYTKQDDLNMSPTKVSSLLEYNTLFGGAPESVITNVDLGVDNTVSSVTITQPYYMYAALQMFYANGGGDCYIVSVGLYTAAVAKADLKNGIDTLKKKDEPSLLLFPDAVTLGKSDFYDVQQYAMAHCNALQNRFCILDTLYTIDNDLAFSNAIDDHRTGLGVNNLNYGAVYTPWLQSNQTGDFTYIDFSSVITKLTISIPLLSLTSDPVVNPMISAYDVLISDGVNINTAIGTFIAIAPPFKDLEKLKGNAATILSNFQTSETTFKVDAANPGSTLAQIQTDYQNLINDTYNLIVLIDSFLAPGTINTADLKNAIGTEITNVLAAPGGELANLVILNTTMVLPANSNLIGINPVIPAIPVLNNAALNAILTAVVPPNPAIFPNPAAAVPADQIQNMLTTEVSYIAKAYSRLYTSLGNIINSLFTALQSKESALYSSFSVYKTIRDYLNNSAVTLLPPSGAVAGLYAYTDDNRGVWKAPANVSVSGVVAGSGVSIDITDDMQTTLNVDVTGGKSFNAIRDFTGKGTLIWGARTLAGNDEDWRYISVRRFCIMVEQSIKNSISWAVFESNDANTWMRIKGMIENFLIVQWRNGALQGAKSTDAFNVQVGLGITMTAQDILDGKLNVLVKIAVVHPAEFIILTFTQMMATS
jgi:phage tail sheath protein FI